MYENTSVEGDLVVLSNPSSGRQLPAQIILGKGSQTRQQGVTQRHHAEKKVQLPSQTQALRARRSRTVAPSQYLL